MNIGHIDGSLAVAIDEDYGFSEFVTAITHDDKNSFYRFGSKTDAGWREGRSFRASRMVGLSYFEEHDAYVTHNGFASPSSRKTENCRQVNAIVQDIDFHQTPDMAGELAEVVLSLLRDAWDSGAFPLPTLAIDSGCGLHLLYSLESSTSFRRTDGSVNEKGLAFVSDIEKRLDDALDILISKWEFLSDVEVDRSVHDVSRVTRVPGSLNTRTGRVCRVVFSSGRYCSLASMSKQLPRPVRKKALAGAGAAKVMKYEKLQMTRLSRIRELQEARKLDCEGKRELMCFVFYNTAVQVYLCRQDAAAELAAFNRRFRNPISESEIINIVRAVDEVGFYRMSATKVAEKLQLSPDEADRFFRSRRIAERVAKKAATAAKRAVRDSRIRELYSTGLTQVMVAREVGCSERTVRSVLSEARDLDKPCDVTADAENPASSGGFSTKKCTGKKMADVSSCVSTPFPETEGCATAGHEVSCYLSTASKPRLAVRVQRKMVALWLMLLILAHLALVKSSRVRSRLRRTYRSSGCGPSSAVPNSFQELPRSRLPLPSLAGRLRRNWRRTP